ncbi:MAG: radical SAM protein [Deferribacteraceae bacterium]|jgi:histone acetyltransferase (RNA polymerase elongator complex component)|nr:radical SAM protein [Deferribacteraceae bacterium]
MSNRYKYKILPVFIPFSGCRSRCIYCDQTTITGITDTDVILSAEKQIKRWMKHSNEWNEVAFYGGSFTRLPSGIRRKLYDLAHPHNIRLSTCPDSIDAYFETELKEYPIKTVELGIQSLSENVLRLNGRNYCISDIKEVFKKLTPLVDISAQFMVCMYGESRGDLLFTASLVHELNAKYARIYPTVVFAGTKLHTITEDGGYIPSCAAESLMRSAWLYISLEAAFCRVIRIGLPPEVKDKITGGIWHESYGEFVKTLVVASFTEQFGITPDMPDFYGYKGLLKDNFSLPRAHGVDTMCKVSQRLKGQFNEGDKWFAEKQNFDFASRICHKANLG